MCTVHLVHPGGYLQCATWLIAGREGAVLVGPGSGYAEDELLAGGRRAGAVPGPAPRERGRGLLLSRTPVLS